VVFGSYLVRPIAAAMMPVMVIAVAMVLQGRDPLPFVAWAGPAAIALASAWTWFRMRSVIVEVVVTNNGAAALTILESLVRSTRPRLQRVFDVRRNDRGIQITVGLATYVLESDEWPRMEDLIRDLESARTFYT
jgi:hypothetical protein